MAPKCVHAKIGASILNCNFIRIRDELKELIDAGIDFVHLDVMDGNFVDDITFGPSFVLNLIRDFPGITFEVHMMVEHPMKFISSMAKAGVSRYIFHYEVTKNMYPEYKYSVSLAINPDTSVQVVEPFLNLVDSILIMTVRPGLGGQKFMANMMHKVQHLRSLKQSEMIDIELDGGVSPDNTEIC
ncbi:ribulose-phosphate 3-epimerase-like protein, partial [Euroglyphus maynei]